MFLDFKRIIYILGVLGLLVSGILSYITSWSPTNLPISLGSMALMFYQYGYSSSLVHEFGKKKQYWFYSVVLVLVFFIGYHCLRSEYAKALDYTFQLFIVISTLLKYQSDERKESNQNRSKGSDSMPVS